MDSEAGCARHGSSSDRVQRTEASDSSGHGRVRDQLRGHEKKALATRIAVLLRKELRLIACTECESQSGTTL